MENIENLIKNCQKCGNLPKLTCNSMQIRPTNILVLGESPAKDGWIQSGRAFYNKEGKLQATGKVLSKLLAIIGLTIDDINFTEVCKCIISDRKNIRTCLNNCRSILIKQIDKFDFDIILTMGQYPTEAVLGMKIDKLKDVVGNKFKISLPSGNKIVIPIYHTSPANPLSYKGNLPIFENLAKEI